MEEENSTELLQRFRRDRRILLNFILSGSLIKKVVIAPGAASLDDVDLDQVSLDFFLNCARKGELLELSEAIQDYHDNTLFPHMFQRFIYCSIELFHTLQIPNSRVCLQEDCLSLFPHHQFCEHSHSQNQLILNHLKSCPVYPNLSLSVPHNNKS
ncbi:hypothetical protein AABB24_022038 [Solanum stoloniferum]|uniref:Uncharacterized protein n=1 Tax=Solanum stoloniferum TaxID=62892 RepID=A0ABD2SY72_9SOLN